MAEKHHSTIRVREAILEDITMMQAISDSIIELLRNSNEWKIQGGKFSESSLIAMNERCRPRRPPLPKTIVISECGLNDSQMIWVSNLIPACGKDVERLDLSSNNFGSRTLIQLVELVKSSPQLKELKITGNSWVKNSSEHQQLEIALLRRHEPLECDVERCTVDQLYISPPPYPECWSRFGQRNRNNLSTLVLECFQIAKMRGILVFLSIPKEIAMKGREAILDVIIQNPVESLLDPYELPIELIRKIKQYLE